MTVRARIFQQPKTAMQSGRAGTDEWVLEFEPTGARQADPLMGWSGSADTRAQVHLRFESRAEAVAYAEREALHFEVELPRVRKFVPKSYSDNFRFGRSENWTH
jgi:hypothetical protein